MESQGSSSDEGLQDDLLVEIFSRSKLTEVAIKSHVWSPEVAEILDFINKRILRGGIEYPAFVEIILSKIVRITSSEYGIILMKDGNRLECISLGEKCPGILDSPHKKSFDTIFGYAIQKGKGIISNRVKTDPRIQKMPKDHPSIKTLLVVPIRSSWILSLANKKSYKVADIQVLLPLLGTLSRILKRASEDKESLLSRSNQDIRNRFLAAMSHDLRTPLNGILGMITLLPEAGPLNIKQSEYVKTIKECTFQMVTLVNNFLDFNKMVSDTLTLKKGPLNVSEIVQDSLAIVRGNAVNKGLKLNSKLPSISPILLGDKSRLIQVLSNLLSNAVKFTERGEVRVEVEFHKTPETKPQKWKVIFKVQDTGIGIDEEDQDRIFEFFRQAKSLNTFLSKSGTGFGLSFSRELVRLMGGKLWVESVKGKGSTFSFFVELEEELPVSQNSDILRGTKVIVVDDRVEMRVQISEILFRWGCIPIVLGSAREALSYLSNDSKFDFALIDICMPSMSGIELAQEIRQRYPCIPLIGISSNELTGGEEYFDHYTYKPVDQNQLYSLASDCLQKKQSSKKKKSRKRLQILIAEDNVYNAYTLQELLISLGFRRSNIKIVPDGKTCVQEAISTEYDVILMDILMPVMDGIEAAKCLQNSASPMIIAISAAVTDKDKCREVGISSYLEKPITRDKLETALLPLVKKNHKGVRKTHSK